MPSSDRPITAMAQAIPMMISLARETASWNTSSGAEMELPAMIASV